MKKIFLVYVLFTFAGLSFLLSETSTEIELKEKPSFSYVYMSFSGSFKTMAQKIMEFMGEFFKQGLKPEGALISVYYNSPEQVAENELKWDIGFPVSSEIVVKSPLQKGTYEKKSVLEYLHKGSYDLLPQVYKKLGEYIEANNMDIVLPTYEFYLNSPMDAKPEDLLTRIEIPVKKQ